MKNLLFGSYSSGQGMVEYALILALVAIVVIGALTLLGTNVSNVLGNVNGDLAGGAGTGGITPPVIPVSLNFTCPASGHYWGHNNSVTNNVTQGNCTSGASVSLACNYLGGNPGDNIHIHSTNQATSSSLIASCTL